MVWNMRGEQNLTILHESEIQAQLPNIAGSLSSTSITRSTQDRGTRDRIIWKYLEKRGSSDMFAIRQTRSDELSYDRTRK